MRGLDGNYLNTQGDALARLQVAYQAEQNRQQLRAQTEAMNDLRKLREQVNEPKKKDAFTGPREIKDDQGSTSEFFQGGEKRERKPSKAVAEEDGRTVLESELKHAHIDIRI